MLLFFGWLHYNHNHDDNNGDDSTAACGDADHNDHISKLLTYVMYCQTLFYEYHCASNVAIMVPSQSRDSFFSFYPPRYPPDDM